MPSLVHDDSLETLQGTAVCHSFPPHGLLRRPTDWVKEDNYIWYAVLLVLLLM